MIVGPNGEGKTNLLEAVGYLATLRSFRGAPTEALIRAGAPAGVVRAEGERDGRRMLIEAELRRSGRDRAQINRQPLQRNRDLLGALQVSVFAPDDLQLVKGGPGERRTLLDDLLVALHPRHDRARTEVERVLRQRAALLRSAGGNPRPGPDVLATLDVWDAKLAEAGGALVRAREGLVAALVPLANEAYAELAGGIAVAPGGRAAAHDSAGSAAPDGFLAPDAPAAVVAPVVPAGPVELRYQRSWEGELAEALGRARADDLRRAATTVGPHRDDLYVALDGLAARTHASQGEQRSLAFALRVAGHRLVTERIGSPPILLLDDVFSELDPARAAALLRVLPAGQTLLTTAGEVPPGAEVATTVRVGEGRLELVAP